MSLLPNPSTDVCTRRRFLLGSTAALSSALSAVSAGRLLAQQPAAPAIPLPDTPLPDTRMKFTPEGVAKPFAGNTVICHLPAQCALRDRMALMHDELAASPFHTALGLTSIASYHMTVFPGANDQGRAASGWPSYVPRDASIAECTRMVQERMAAAVLECELPFRVRIDPEATLAHPTAATLRMVPVDDTENRKLRSVRDRLADLYGFRTPGHDTYGFHITMSYQVRPFSPAERQQYRTMLLRALPELQRAAPVLELGSPEFCSFPDMNRFDPLLLLRTR